MRRQRLLRIDLEGVEHSPRTTTWAFVCSALPSSKPSEDEVISPT
jgi:hypothetical protein